MIDEARTTGATVHFASLMDICHLKHAELEAEHQKHKGRVVFRGDIVKENSGSYAVFTEQGSSASQMTAAKIMDIISRLPGCDGQAADAVSAFTQVKMEGAHKWRSLVVGWGFGPGCGLYSARDCTLRTMSIWFRLVFLYLCCVCVCVCVCCLLHV